LMLQKQGNKTEEDNLKRITINQKFEAFLK
jgi:hypothetical protein